MSVQNIYIINTINYYFNLTNEIITNIQYDTSTKILVLTDEELTKYNKINKDDYDNMWTAKINEFSHGD
jgi:hypothetical protein